MATTTRFKLQYHGSIFWLIFWLILFFPIAFVLLLTDTSFVLRDTTYHVHYEGSRFWLGFWVLVFFPIAFILLFFNGLSMTIDDEMPKTAEAQPTKIEEDVSQN